MAASDAKPFPKKNEAYRVTFPIFDADGDLVSGAADLDSEISKDGGTFADCTNEATEIATNSGMYYLDLTSTEMNADTVAIIVKTSTSGAKTTPLVMYPVEDGDIPVNVRQIEGADPSDTIRDAVVDDATRIDASALNTLSGSAPTAGEIADAVWDEALADHNTEDSFGNVINDLVDEDGGGVYQFNSNALELAPTGSGSGDWTADEKEQIRYRLQLDGTQTAPAADAPLQMPVSTDALNQSEQFAQDLAGILDNTAPRKRLYIEGIDITPPEGTTGIDITGEGFPLNIACQNSQNIPAITIKGGGTTGEEIHLVNGVTNLLNLIRAEILNATGLNDYPNSSVGKRLSRIPNEDPGTEGGLPTVDSENRIAGIQGTKNQLDDLNDLTQQQVRDAMKLAPTAGEPAAGSVDAHLDTIETDAGNAADNVGTAISLDGGTATLAGMLTKMADDNGGADFDAGTDSLNVIASDPIPELAAGDPPVTPNLKQAIMLLYMALRNASETERTGATTLLRKIRNDVGTVIAQGSMTQSSTSLNQGTLEAPPETP